MKEIDILRFRCDFEIVLSKIKDILQKRGHKFEDISFNFEKTAVGEEVVVHGYRAEDMVRCRVYIKIEDLIV